MSPRRWSPSPSTGCTSTAVDAGESPRPQPRQVWPSRPSPDGPNLRSWVVCLLVFQHVPVARVVELLTDLSGARPSAGWVCRVLRETTATNNLNSYSPVSIRCRCTFSQRGRPFGTLRRVSCEDSLPLGDGGA